jgi:aminoglycoside 3-N-acetyltransferase
MAADYDKAAIDVCLAGLPLEAGDIVFSHSNAGFFGRLAGAKSGADICAALAEAILRRIGPNGTLVVPTFTYSFSGGDIFDVDHTPSKMGAFAEWVRKEPRAHRSADPFYSVAAIGARAVEMTRDAPENSFAPGAFFDRLTKAGGKVLNMNFDAGSTLVHYVERELRVPYRFDKSFRGTIREGGVERQARATIWVRYLSDDALTAAFEPFSALAREKGRFVTRPLGRGEIGLIGARDTFDLIKATLPARPWFLTRAEALGVKAPRIVAEATVP